TVVAYKWSHTCGGAALNGNQSISNYTSASLGVGTHTFYFHVQDDDSDWSTNCPSRTITVDPRPTVILKGNGSAGSVTVNEGGSVNLTWETTNADACTGNWGSNPKVGENLIGQTQNNILSDITYSITCTGPGGTSDLSEVDVTVSLLPNLQVSLGSIQFENFDSVGGVYQDVKVNYIVKNVGNAPVGKVSHLRLQLDLNNDTSINATSPAINIPDLAGPNGEHVSSYTFSPAGGVTPTTNLHKILATIDYDLQVDEFNEDDNTAERTGTTNYPDPGIELTANPTVVQTGATSTLTWDTKQPYDMDCTITGPGLNGSDTFNPSSDGTEGTLYTNPITSKSTYLLRCVVTATGQIFTATAPVETIVVIEEI
ncbi:hypothetical protein KC906_01510, partial [Candidatus Kaiserbacteria bacterium]|nr:hypothetical protein [Candidatus Kaiserbacteria bacterium]